MSGLQGIFGFESKTTPYIKHIWTITENGIFVTVLLRELRVSSGKIINVANVKLSHSFKQRKP